jgi:plasmid maintenance system antidote protein VapI
LPNPLQAFALRVELFLRTDVEQHGTSAQFWLNLQSLYDLRVAKVKIGKSIKTLPTLKRRELVHA